MELITYNHRYYEPGWYFRFYAANGVILFSPDLSEELKIGTGMRVIFHQNKECPEQWFLEIVAKKGFLVYKINTMAWGISNTRLVKELIKSTGSSARKGTCLVGKDPVNHEGVKLYPVDISSIKQTNLSVIAS